MKTIKIEISKAVLQSFSVKLGEEKPEVSATLALLTAQGKRITTYSIDTDGWDEESRFELPINFVEPIKQIMKELEIVAVKHCREGQKQLKAPKE